MDSVIIQKSKLAKVALILVCLSYFTWFLFIFLDVSKFDTVLGLDRIINKQWFFNIIFYISFGLDFLSFMLSIIALVFIKKYHLLGKKVAIVSLIGSILLPILFISLFVLVLSGLRFT